jgi:hypothetical protein
MRKTFAAAFVSLASVSLSPSSSAERERSSRAAPPEPPRPQPIVPDAVSGPGIDKDDLRLFWHAYGMARLRETYDARADRNRDGKVDVDDLASFLDATVHGQDPRMGACESAETIVLDPPPQQALNPPQGFQPPFPRKSVLIWATSVDPAYHERIAKHELISLGRFVEPAQWASISSFPYEHRSLAWLGSYYIFARNEEQRAEEPYLTADQDNFWLRTSFPAGPVVSEWPYSWDANITNFGATNALGQRYNQWYPSWIYDYFISPSSVYEHDGVIWDNVFSRIYHYITTGCENQTLCDQTPVCQCGPADIDSDGVPDTDANYVDGLWVEGMRTMLQNMRGHFSEHHYVLGNGDGERAYKDDMDGTFMEKTFFIHGEPDHGTPEGFAYRWEDNMFDPNHGYITARQYDYAGRDNTAIIFDTLPNFDVTHTMFEPHRTETFERDKRFKLASCLMGDGYFQMRLWGQDTYWWLAEFADDGLGEGYLGQPREQLSRILQPVGSNVLVNAGFENGVASDWTFSVSSPAQAFLTADSATSAEGDVSARISVTTHGWSFDVVRLSQDGVSVTEDSDYTLIFWGKADPERRVHVELEKLDGTPISHNAKTFRLGPNWERFVYSFKARETDSDARLLLGMGDTSGDVWLDGVEFRCGSTNVFRRYFDGGVVLLNATDQPRTIELNGSYRMLQSSANPAFYDGRWVTSVTLGAYDGLILLEGEGLPTGVGG